MTMTMHNQVGAAEQRHMGMIETSLHMLAMVCTIGLWYPVYKHRKNKLSRTTRFYV
jgi:hypothetical protein